MRSQLLRAVAGLLALVGMPACTDLAAPPPTAAGPAPDLFRASVSLPFTGRIEGVLHTVLPFAPGSDPACNANFSGDPAAPGPSVSLFDEAQGVFSHLGRSVLHAVTCFDPASPFSSGHGTITAANGDQLWIEFDNSTLPSATDPTLLHTTGTQRVTGGTGRFEGAAGDQRCAFEIRLTSETTARIQGSCAGSLRYGGSP